MTDHLLQQFLPNRLFCNKIVATSSVVAKQALVFQSLRNLSQVF